MSSALRSINMIVFLSQGGIWRVKNCRNIIWSGTCRRQSPARSPRWLSPGAALDRLTVSHGMTIILVDGTPLPLYDHLLVRGQPSCRRNLAQSSQGDSTSHRRAAFFHAGKRHAESQAIGGSAWSVWSDLGASVGGPESVSSFLRVQLPDPRSLGLGNRLEG